MDLNLVARSGSEQLDDAQRADRRQDGFSLVEILIVIVILGILATVSVFAVKGVTDRGETSVIDADQDILETAEESYRALHGRYATEAELVAAGVLRTESTVHDVVVNPDDTYTLAVVTSP
jgi:prepilin-type N-terminal cleavage/methylation domain-containing protein